ncbi:anthrone oxygenase family protein [Bradyrhizobium sp.]|uniref:anthrone oxygenase family protein n=1 Tax=Bradyrhizobium sp. TaxID=376 RepID=UPI0025BEDACA|nr:anthrone oxygenase family protein [Bradyrhizobium sp.]
MLDRAIFTLTFAAAIGSGVIGGIFYAFSTVVMAALGRLPSAQGAGAMKAINVTVINPVFMIAFMGTGVLCLVLAGVSLIWWGRPGGILILAASLLYLLGCFGVTLLCNVPLNHQLAAVAPAQEAALWSRYLDLWTAWNHVRTLAPILSAILFTAALLLA